MNEAELQCSYQMATLRLILGSYLNDKGFNHSQNLETILGWLARYVVVVKVNWD